MCVLYIYNYESSISGFCCCVYTRNKGMLFGTNINGAGKRVSIMCTALQTTLFDQNFSFYIQWNNNNIWNFLGYSLWWRNHISKHNSSFSAMRLIWLIQLRNWNKQSFLTSETFKALFSNDWRTSPISGFPHSGWELLGVSGGPGMSCLPCASTVGFSLPPLSHL